MADSFIFIYVIDIPALKQDLAYVFPIINNQLLPTYVLQKNKKDTGLKYYLCRSKETFVKLSMEVFTTTLMQFMLA